MNQIKNEEAVITLLYIGLETGECAARHRFQKVSLAEQVRNCGTPLPLHNEKRKTQAAETWQSTGNHLQIRYLPVPEYWYGRKKLEGERLFDLLQEAVTTIQPEEWYLQEQVAHRLGGREKSRPPQMLFAALLERQYQRKPFDTVAVRMDGRENTGQAIELLTPYLPGINHFYLIREAAGKTEGYGESDGYEKADEYGETTGYGEEIAEYLTGSYGIVPVYARKVPKGVLCLDLGWNLGKDYAWELPEDVITSSKAAKFLDTQAKNGYNT